MRLRWIHLWNPQVHFFLFLKNPFTRNGLPQHRGRKTPHCYLPKARSGTRVKGFHYPFCFISQWASGNLGIGVCAWMIPKKTTNQPTNQPTNQMLNSSISLLLAFSWAGCLRIRLAPPTHETSGGGFVHMALAPFRPEPSSTAGSQPLGLWKKRVMNGYDLCFWGLMAFLT